MDTPSLVDNPAQVSSRQTTEVCASVFPESSVNVNSATLGGRAAPPESNTQDPSRHEDEGSFPPSESASGEESTARSAKKARIDLAPDQPPTAEGKPRARVYVACQGCRNRKVRCDGAKPVCYNCRQRDATIVACHYDETPIRRGQDKAPGTRIRSSTGSRKPRPSRREAALSTVDRSESVRDAEDSNQCQDTITTFDPSSFQPNHVDSYILPDPPGDAPEQEFEESTPEHLTSEPSMQFARETWWDSLLTLYAIEDNRHNLPVAPLAPGQRTAATLRIFTDIRCLFRTSVYWGSFIHLPRFFENLLDSTRRSSIQPALVLGMLAMGTFVQSSELRRGSKGRTRALKLIDQAHAAIQASLSAHWVDMGLIQAAWLLAFFEMQAHPKQSWERNRSAFVLLDSLIRLFSLTTLDADLPDSRFSLFAMHDTTSAYTADVNVEPIPTGVTPKQTYATFAATPQLHPNSPAAANAGCSCAQYTLRQQWPGVLEVAPLWEATVMWPVHATESDIRREECRRLVWSSVMLATGHNSYTSATAEVDHADLSIKNYDNFALLLPGEALVRSGTPVSRDDVWALYLRAMLLWHTGLRMRSDRAMPDLQRAQFAIDAWLEADAIEDALGRHTCNLESRLAYQAREFLFNARMCISSDFQRYLPHVSSDRSSLLYREKCESWLRGQMAVTKYLWDCLHTNPANELGTRSFVVYWFMSHVTRALVLWENDRSMLLALEAAKVFVLPLEYLMQLWPCPRQREKWQGLRYTLVDACLKAGVTPPTPVLPPPPPRAGLCAPEEVPLCEIPPACV